MSYELRLGNRSGHLVNRYDVHRDLYKRFPAVGGYQRQPFNFFVENNSILVRSTQPFKGATQVSNPYPLGSVWTMVVDLCPTKQHHGKEVVIPSTDRAGCVAYLKRTVAKAGLELVDENVAMVSIPAYARKRNGMIIPTVPVRVQAQVRVVNPADCSQACFEGVATSHRFLGFGLPLLFP